MWSQPQLWESQSPSKVQPAPIARLVHTCHQHFFDPQSLSHTQAAPSCPAAVAAGSALAVVEAEAVGSARAGSLLVAFEALEVGSLVACAVASLLAWLVASALTKEEPEAEVLERPPR